MTHADRWWLGKIVCVVFLGFVACGEEGSGASGSGASAEAAAAAARIATRAAAASAGATQSSSFLVSFSGGSIPANAGDLISAAGGAIAARYSSLGAVLARSANATFAAALRSAAGVEEVGAVTAAHSRIERPSPSASDAGRAHASPPTGPTASSAGGDPLSFRQWDMDQIHAPEARAISGGSRSVLVGVVDSGVDVTHPDLVGQVDGAASASCVGGAPNPAPAAWASDFIGHGTHVAGTIAALKNGVGIVGVAPGVRLAAVKVAVDDPNDPNFGLVLPDAFVCAIDWAIAHDFDLINASLTIDPFMAPIDDIFCSDEPDRAAVVSIVRRAVLAAGQKKITVVAASGNFFTDLASLRHPHAGSQCRVLPVQLPRVIGVSAVGYTQALSFYSNYGSGAIDLAGPGGDSLIPDPLVTDTAASGQVLASVPPGSLFYAGAADYDGQVQDCATTPCATYAYLQGVSQAVPHVSGVAALVLSRSGKLPPDALLAKLSQGASALPCPPSPYDPGGTGQPATCQGPAGHNNFYGAGEVDALAALR